MRRQPKNPLNGALRRRKQRQGEGFIRLELDGAKGEEGEGKREHEELLISKTSAAYPSNNL